jgi:polysaccharide biosynthesis/export protein
MKVSLFRSLGTVVPVTTLLILAAAYTQAQSAPSQSGLQQHPLAQLEQSQPKSSDEYTLAAGDELNVIVAGRPELSGPQTVGPDGAITIATVGSVNLAGLSREAAASAIASTLKRLYTSVSVTVQVTKYGSNKIILFGDVEHPGVMQFEGPPSLIEAITRGGALLGDGKTHSGMPTSCTFFRGKDTELTVNLKEAFRSGDIKLRRGDLIYVESDSEKLISVLGEVKTPRPVPLKDESTLISLITDAGGFTPEAGSNPTIQIINPKTGKEQIVKQNDLLKNPMHTDVTLERGDYIFVNKSGIAKMGFVLTQLSPAAQVMSAAAIGAIAF